ncbi:hypothetical protein Tco_0677398, partial [Tanacetum coccineum]
PVPLPEDPYEAIRQAYLDGTNTESESFEDPVKTETPESPITVAPPTSLPESTPPTLVPILCSITRMAVRVPPAMSPSLSTSMAEVAVMFESAFLEDDDEEDKEIKESLHSDSVSEDEAPTAEDGDPASGTRFLLRGTRALGNGLGLGEEEEVVPTGDGSGSAPESERPKRVLASKHPTLTTWTDSKDGMVYIDVPAYPSPAPPIQTPPSPEWSSRSLPISPAPSIIPSPISSPMIPLIVPSPLATPATAETEGFLTELGARVEMQGD